MSDEYEVEKLENIQKLINNYNKNYGEKKKKKRI